MSRALGRFVLRFRFVILAVWLIAAIWMVTQAPSLKDVAVSETSAFLPADSPSMQASAAIAKAFPSEGNQSMSTVVLSRAGGMTESDNVYAKALSEWLSSPQAPEVVQNVASVFNQPGTQSVLVSPDKSTMLISFGLQASNPDSDATSTAIKAIRQHIADNPAPAGMSANLTGTAPISSDQRSALMTGVDRTAIVTILLVIFVLLLIYRSPVAAMTPLLTIGMAYLVSRGTLGYLASWGWKVSSFVDTFIIVIIFGVGTDYCLFLLSRFREELGRRGTHDEAIVSTVSAIGAVISASAATVIVALIFMASGRFIMLQTMGPAMALCVFITLLAGLTLTPAMVAILGRYLFWPRHDEISHESGKTWQRIAEIATTRYHIVIPVVVIALLVPYLFLPQTNRMFDVLAEMPKETDSVQGFDAMSKGFDPGELLPVTVLLTNNQGNILDNLDKVDQVATSLQGASQVQRLRSILEPTGDQATAEAFHVSTQLKQVSGGLQTLINSLDNPQATASQQSGSQQGGGLSSIGSYLKDLGRVQTVAANPAYTEAVTRTQAVEAGLTKLTQSSLVANQVDAMAKQMAGLSQTISAAQSITATQTSTATTDAAAQFKDLTTYLTQLGQAYPALAREASYQDAMQAIPALVDDLNKSQQMVLVTNQLGLLAQQLQNLSKTLATPAGALALSGAGSQQLTALAGYYSDLGKAYPELAGNASYQSIMAHLAKLDAAGKQMQSAPPADLSAALAGLKAEVDGLAADTLALQQYFATTKPAAQFVPQNSATLAAMQQGAPAPDPAKSSQRLAADLSTLAAVAKTQTPNATFTPTGIAPSADVKAALAQLKAEATALQGALNKLAAAADAGQPLHFIPSSVLTDPAASGLTKYFLSQDGKSTRLTLILKARPYSPDANREVQSLEPVVAKAAQAAGLTAAIGGAPVVLNDVQQTINSDFVRIALFTLFGVFIILILLLRSLVAPIYLVLTVLLSYGATLGISTIVFQNILGQEGVNYIIPIIVFVLLVALGADYNIFLMSRVREEAEGRTTREGIRIASAYTGSIITSCGIILAGTFAAMMVAPIQTLFQIGFAVAIGVLLDTFVIRAVLVPAIAAALGEWNWWPSKIKTSPGYHRDAPTEPSTPGGGT